MTTKANYATNKSNYVHRPWRQIERSKILGPYLDIFRGSRFPPLRCECSGIPNSIGSKWLRLGTSRNGNIGVGLPWQGCILVTGSGKDNVGLASDDYCEDFKKGTRIISGSLPWRILINTMLFQVHRKFKFEIGFRCNIYSAYPSWPLFTESICQYKQIDHRGQREILVYKYPSQAQNAERIPGQCSETTINASKAERANAVTRLAD